MIQEQEILNEIQAIRKKTELLANPLYSDFVGSHFWGDINQQLQDIEHKLLKDKETYKW